MLLSGFTQHDGTCLDKSPRVLSLHKDEESYLSRFSKVRGFSYEFTETMYCITRDALEMPVKKRKIYGGTNRSNVWGPIACPSFTTEHHNMITWKEKKDLYSTECKNACRVGGASPQGIQDAATRKPETVEPVSFHAYTSSFWEEIIHSHSAVRVIDFNTGPGYVAEACMTARIPYVGFVQTTTHERVVRRYLFKRTWDQMCTPGSPHYETHLRDLVVPLGEALSVK